MIPIMPHIQSLYREEKSAVFFCALAYDAALVYGIVVHASAAFLRRWLVRF
jgi:hypothetical protein